ncbi:AAA domain-containing protein [Mycoplasma enhydrae]|uniref:AAA domain-containing protein n=1 Tax=Mycoplasma enhydrae TaxID=2499220 RepID=UPI0021E888C8|nr:AAA domain-containing protein [Mycoplasma enhydrae]MCV3753609.1 AAA domain-containing protein [Mycoplasma enhydrae]
MEANFKKINGIIQIYNETNGCWEEKTDEIKHLTGPHFDTTYKKHWKITYKNNTKRTFCYGLSKMNFFYPLIKLNWEKYNLLIDNCKIVNAKEIYTYNNRLYKIITINDEIITSDDVKKININNSSNITNYFWGLAKRAEELTSEENALNFLAQNYSRNQVNINSILFNYLKGIKLKNLCSKPKKYIVPFSFNEDQYSAIEKAFESNVSIIEGPPGTGKTQTILNLISNIILSKNTCAIISNNNSAIENIYEKLEEEGFGFLAAKLGNSNNVEEFFNKNDNDDERNKLLHSENEENENWINEYTKLKTQVDKILELEIEISKLKSEISDLKVEQNNHAKKQNNVININKNLNVNNYIRLINKLEKSKKINLLWRFKIRHSFKVNFKEVNYEDFVYSLEKMFYEKTLKSKEEKLIILETQYQILKENNAFEKLSLLSKNILIKHLKDHYSNLNEFNFNNKNYKSNYRIFYNFLHKHPIVLSTSQSLIKNVPKDFLFDFLIIDEASQGDLLSSVLSLNCAKNLIVVGDSKQLKQIEAQEIVPDSQKSALELNIPEAYHYHSQSILSSISKAMQDVPITVLRKHYRCDYDIINFCNQMFYNSELIPMKSKPGNHIKIIKLSAGNHNRKSEDGKGLFSEREIEEIKLQLESEDNLNNIGVISPFRAQARKIQEIFKDTNLESDTIHKFQGRQKNKIYLSFVVSSLNQNDNKEEKNFLYDFVTNEQLLNVAISRAKNNITAVVSEGVYNSKNNIISDFIKYAENLYGSEATIQSNIVSVFDSLYLAKEENYKNNKKKNKWYDSKAEEIMDNLIQDNIKKYNALGYLMHVPLSTIIDDASMLDDEEEKKYAFRSGTHVDFVIYNKITKKFVFAIEVDGKEHLKEKQKVKDNIKNKILNGQNNIKLYRFPTYGSNEIEKLKVIFENEFNKMLSDFQYLKKLD